MKHLCRIPGHPSTWPLGAPVRGHTSIQRAIGGAGPCHRTPWSEELQLTPGTSMDIWICLKMGYTPNYSHLIGIMIINHWV
jgi:hypothetical protein